MRLEGPFRTAVRFGAVILVVAAVVLALVAALVPSESRPALTPVADPASIDLPKPGIFGGEVMLYGRSDQPKVDPDDLGCVLLNRAGREQSSAKLSGLGALQAEDVELDGQTLQPLFAVRSYPSGARVECSDAESAAPLALGARSTFGSVGPLVRAFAGMMAVLCLVIAAVGFFLTRRRP